MGRVTGPFGVQGWVKIHPYTETSESLTRYRSWWMGKQEPYAEQAVVEARVHGAEVLAKLDGVDDRDAAALMKGWLVAVPRAELPKAQKDEYYWTDLIGLAVVNTEGTRFGTVKDLMETGANDVLVVQGEEGEASGKPGQERLIPFIRQVILDVDLDGGTIKVDWGADY
jgi:16S rRNA processing protein RimM